MTTAMKKLTRTLLVTGAGVAMIMLTSAANAEQCRKTVDEDGDAVMMCGSTAYYTDDDTKSKPHSSYSGRATASDDEDDDDDDDDDDELGTGMVEGPQDCEPGKYWMMDGDGDDDEFDIPIKCN